MDPSAGDSSADGLFEVGSPPSPSPAPRGNAPPTPKEGGIAAGLAFRPPPRPGSSMRKGRKSEFNSPAPPPLPAAYSIEPLADSTNFDGYNYAGPGSSTPSRPSSSSSAGHTGLFTFNTAADDAQEAVATTRACRQKLQALREENQNQVNSAGMLGAGLLGLRNRIESLMDELAHELNLAEANADHSQDPASKIQELSERIEAEIEEMELEKQKLYKEVMTHGVAELAAADQSMTTATDSPSKAARVASAIKNLTGTTPSKPVGGMGTSIPTPRQGDRRSRNAAARQAKADSELINEIQAGLVQEVRRLQGLLKERDDQRGALERANADLVKQLDLFKPRVIQLTEAEDALKQENWDLEVAKQGLEEQLGERDKLLKKAELESTRLSKDLGKARETIDSQRLEIDGHLAELEKVKKQRETEVAMARKERAGMQRDVSDLQSELQRYKAQQHSNRGGIVSRSVSNSYMSEHDAADDDAGGDDAETLAARLRAAYANEVGNRSPADSVYSEDLGPRSPLVSRLGRDKEAQDLRAKLAMAQKKAAKDAAEKRKIRERNVELKKLLLKAGIRMPTDLDDDVESSEDEEPQWLDDHGLDSPSAKRASFKSRSTKLVKRPSVARRFRPTSSNSTDSILERTEENGDGEASEGDQTVARHTFGDDDTISAEGSPRASLDGIDPAFADVLQPGFGTPANQQKPKRHPGRGLAEATRRSPLARAANLSDTDEDERDAAPRSKSRLHGRRSNFGGRPESAVFEPSALGNEMENLRGAEDLQDAAAGLFDDEDVEGGVEAETDAEAEEGLLTYAEAAVATEPLPDLVTPALEERERQHLATVERLQSVHTQALSALAAKHEKALDALREQHRAEITELGTDREALLALKEQQHADNIAERNKIHEAALAEARSRHSRALAEQVATSSAELAKAIASYKTSMEELERRHKAEQERHAESHTFALSQRDRQHAESTRELQEAHTELTRGLQEAHAAQMEQQEADYRAALADAEEALGKAQAEIDDLKQAIEDLEARLKAANEQNAEAEKQHRMDSDKHTAALRDLQGEFEASAAAATAAKAKHEVQLEKLRANISDLEERLALTEQRASNVQTERDAASSEAIKKAQGDIDTLKASLLAAEAKLKATEQDAAKQQADLKAEIEATSTKLGDVASQLAQAQSNVKSLEAEKTAREAELAEATSKLADLTSDLEQATVQADHHQQESKRFADEAERQAIRLAALNQEHGQLCAKVDEHRRLQSEAEAALAQHKSEAEEALVRLRSEAAEAEARLRHEAESKHARLQNEAKEQHGRLQKDAEEQIRLRQEAEKEHQRLRNVVEVQGKLRQRAEEEAAAAATAAEAAVAANNTATSPTSTSHEVSDNGYVTEAETDAERFEDAVSHMRSTSIDRTAFNIASAVGTSTAAAAATAAADGTPRLPRQLKESACQTDDLAWSSFQDGANRCATPDMVRPLSSMTTASSRPENLVGQGGVMVLGGHQTGRPRDSVSTFGGHRDGSLRIDSPAPTMYTVGAITGRPSRRGSTDSSWSRQTDRAAADEIPPVPPLPDKTKPPTMSMPPPPSMPPPASLPVKRIPSLANTQASSGVGPPRPTSPPPSDLLTRAAQRTSHLQVPSNGGSTAVEQPRSVSRASARSGFPGKPVSSGSQRTRYTSSITSVRSRTYSGETNASQQRAPSQLDSSIYNGIMSGRKSIGSRRSAAGASLRQGGPRQSSAASFVSDVTSELSRRFSQASSQASDDPGDETFVARPNTRTRKVSEYDDGGGGGSAEGTDPMVIHAITQTMIGEYMYKYTRKSMGRGGHSDKRHRRYFWLHPYTKMLYWTISDPGGAKVSEGTSKSASICGVRVTEDSNPSPPGLYHESLVITTATREVKITAPSRERHEAWLGALDYLVHRPSIHDAANVTAEVGMGAMTDATDVENSVTTGVIGRRSKTSNSQRPSLLSAQRSFLSRKSTDNLAPPESTPRRRGSSIGASSVMYPSTGKRRDLPAREYLQQQERERQMSMSPTSSLRRATSRSIGGVSSLMEPDESYDQLSDLNEPVNDPRLQTAEEMLEEDEEEGFEGLDNVRACCDGKHDVGSLAHEHGHGHGGSKRSKRHGRQSSGGSRFSNAGLRSKLDAAVRAAEDRERPLSPSVPPQLPLNLPPKMSVASSMGIATPTELDGSRPADARSFSQPGPSYVERVQKIRQARQSASTIK
ncbi:hypothetical protein ACQY0O_001710 [Thecaphora frezii]